MKTLNVLESNWPYLHNGNFQ